MKINVCFVNWTLLLVTFVLSSILFSLVACVEKPRGLDKVTENVTSFIADVNGILKPVRDERVKSDTKQDPSLSAKVFEKRRDPAESKGTNTQETVAAVQSSFDEPEVKSIPDAEYPVEMKISAETVSHVKNGLTDTGQAVVLTLLESATSELQKHATLHTQGLSSSLDDILSLNSSDNHTVETPPSPEKPIPSVHVIPDRENRSTDDAEDDHYVVHAEPKVLEVRYNVVDVENIIPLPGLVRDNAVVEEDVREADTAAKEGGPTTDKSGGSKTGDTTTPTPDEIPSFSEWAQKQLEEAEKKVLNNSQPGGTVPLRLGGGSKLRSKNYASPDCGAKIVASNPEAESANSVLSPSRDEYVLNACVNRIWLVVELCEAIQAKKIDIANFELFSSSPKDFSVSVSDRFPSRDWRSVGQFTANDVRDVQSYDLHPQMFGKFMKVELHSHYGAEHYCPVSLIRVYGTSEFEVLETEVEAHHATQEIDEDDEEGTLETGDPGDPPRNLFGSAREVVMSIVKKATQALVKGGESGNATGNATLEPAEDSTWETPGLAWVSTPGHLVVCDNCSDALFHSVWELLEQREKELFDFVDIPFVKDALKSGPICVRYGLDFGRRRPEKYPYQPDPGDYLRSLLPDRYVAALCNALAVIERKVVRNGSRDNNGTVVANVTSHFTEPLPNTEYEGLLLPPAATCSAGTTVSSEPCDVPSVTDAAPDVASTHVATDLTSSVKVASQIKPTKTLSEAEVNDGPFSSTGLPEPPVPPDSVRLPEPPAPLESSFSPVENATAAPPEADPGEGDAEATLVVEPLEEPTDSSETYQAEEDPTLDTLLSELKDLDPSLDGSSPPVTSSTAAQLPPQKESVFVRISNRIKALERNMSLSGQYLEELSRRYKRQVEEISRTLNRTLAEAENEAKRRAELEKKGDEELGALRDEIATLTAAVNTLLVERDSWHNKAVVICQHVVLIAIEVLFFVAAVCFCRRLPVWEERVQGSERKWSLNWKKPPEAVEGVKRRKSMEEIPSQQSPKERRKRPSEVALNITGTYSDLLLTEPPPPSSQLVWAAPKAETKRRRRRKKEGGLPKSSSSVSLQQKSSRKTSTNSSSGGGSGPYNSGDVRRASLSELSGSVWIPVHETQDTRTDGPAEPPEGEEKETDEPGRCFVDILSSPPDRPSAPREVNGVGKDVASKNPGKCRSVSSASVPAFMKTAVSSRAGRRASEVSYDDRRSSQTNSVPTPVDGDDRNGFEDGSDRGSEAGGSHEGRKKTKGFKKMVKRFF